MSNPFGATPKYVDYASGGAAKTNQSLVAAQTGRKIKVLALFVQTDATADTVIFESGNSTQLLELNLGANGGAVLPSGSVPWFETAEGEALTLTTGTTSDVSVLVVYIAE